MAENFLSQASNEIAQKSENVFIPDLEKVMEIFPAKFTNFFKQVELEDAIEITLEVGRRPEVRHAGGRIDALGNFPILYKDLAFITEMFPEIEQSNILEIPKTLHRIKVARDFQNKIYSVSCYLGRLVTESADCISDFLTKDKSILLLGRPKSGKTTKLREAAIILSSLEKKVVVVDPYYDILAGGEATNPVLKGIHQYAGAEGQFKKDLILEADEIFSPDVLIVDEVSTRNELMAIKTLTKKGVRVIATMLGTNLEGLIKNPKLFDAIGGIQTVSFDETERDENVDVYRVPEFKRLNEPIFDSLIEIMNVNMFYVYEDVKSGVDGILQNSPIEPDFRTTGKNNMVDERYKNSDFSDKNKKDVRVKSMIQESFFHGASWMGQNFIA